MRKGTFAYTTINELDLPSLTSHRDGFTQNYVQIIRIDSYTTINNGEFNLSCITEIHGKSVISVGNSSFLRCYALRIVDFPSLEIIKDDAFRSCFDLSEIVTDSV